MPLSVADIEDVFLFGLMITGILFITMGIVTVNHQLYAITERLLTQQRDMEILEDQVHTYDGTCSRLNKKFVFLVHLINSCNLVIFSTKGKAYE